jgi:phage replication-related protein YjqB (UPF0714/DUF867 family)
MPSIFRWFSGAGRSPDVYASFDELSRREREGEAWRVVSRLGASGIAVVAPHGGGIEPGTSELASAIAGAEHSLYLFEGLKRSGNGRLHITSTNFREPRLSEIETRADVLIAVHGEASEDSIVYVGGLHDELAARIGQGLSEAGFSVAKHDVLAGLEPTNVCNRGRSARGVQLELSAGLRRRMFQSLDRAGRAFPTAVFERFVRAICTTVEGFTDS